MRAAGQTDDFGLSARKARTTAVLVGLALLVVAAVACNLSCGSVAIPLRELGTILFGGVRTGTNAQVIWSIRLPRLIAAGLLGGALALAGFLLQTFFGNPIAGPYILGISSGAKLAVATTMIVIIGRAATTASWMLVTAAFVGSLATMLLVLVASRRTGTVSSLIVVGVMIGYICSALTDFLVTFASDAHIVNLRSWSQGSFSGTSWADVQVIAVLTLAASACVFALSKPLGAFQMGEGYAQSVGVDTRRFRLVLIVLSSLLAGCVTAYAGPISFVGIAVPHVTKRLLKTSRPIVVVPACFLGGALFCLVCDLIARSVFAPTEVSVSAVTALFGAPVVIAMLVGRQRRRYER